MLYVESSHVAFMNQCYFDYTNRIFQLRFLRLLLQTLNHYGIQKWYQKNPTPQSFSELGINYQVRASTLLLFDLFLFLSMKPMVIGVVTSLLSISLCFFEKIQHSTTQSYEKEDFFSLVLLLSSYFDFRFCDIFCFHLFVI